MNKCVWFIIGHAPFLKIGHLLTMGTKVVFISKPVVLRLLEHPLHL